MIIENKKIKSYFLQRWGLTSSEIERLKNVRKDAMLQEFLAPEEYRRLVFMRWMVMTGRIIEQIQ